MLRLVYNENDVIKSTFLLFLFSFSLLSIFPQIVLSKSYSVKKNAIENICVTISVAWKSEYIMLDCFYSTELFPFSLQLSLQMCVSAHVHTHTCSKAVYIIANFPVYRYQLFKKIPFYLFYTTIDIKMNIRILTHEILKNLKFKSWFKNFIDWRLNFDFIFTGPELLLVWVWPNILWWLLYFLLLGLSQLY